MKIKRCLLVALILALLAGCSTLKSGEIDLFAYSIEAKSEEAAYLEKAFSAVFGKSPSADTKAEKCIVACVNETLSPLVYEVRAESGKIEIATGSEDGLLYAVKHFAATVLGYRSESDYDRKESTFVTLSSYKGTLPEMLNAALKTESLENSPFFSLFGATSSAKAANAVYENFSGASGTDSLVYQFGNEACYFEWIAEKIIFTNEVLYKSALKEKIAQYPQTDNGYIWSWGDSTYWPTGDGDMHYDGLFRYIAAVYDIVKWEDSTAFLKTICLNGSRSGVNGTMGKTVYDKCTLAIDYAIHNLYGSTGVICITESSMLCADGVTRIDKKGERLLWNNTGCVGSSPSNYWDNLCFGNIDAYETALFYHALEAMVGIEEMRGNEAKAAEYRSLMSLVHQKFDETFWDAEKGRYIACIDTRGNRVDYGFTFLNTEALSYGLGDSEKASLIFSWIDGTRTVTGDTVTGDDILNYTSLLKRAGVKNLPEKDLYLAPVSNTVAIESVKEDNKYWWYSLNGAITVTNNAKFGKHLENGGYIFYTVYYELSARGKYLGGDSVEKRLRQIAEVYSYNKLNSDVGTWVEGLVGEFPESGLPYAAFLYSLMGVTADSKGLSIAPQVPRELSVIGTGNFCYGGISYTVAVSKTMLMLQSTGNKGFEMDVTYRPQTGTRCTVIFTHQNGVETFEELAVDADGTLRLSLSDKDIKTVSILWE